MNEAQVGYWLSWIGTGAWGICFWWMHHISSRQNRMLAELREQARRIETLSQTQHDILKEVRPNIDEIRDVVEGVTHDLTDVRRDNIAQAALSEQVAEQISKIDDVAEKVAHVEKAVAWKADADAVGASARFGDLCG